VIVANEKGAASRNAVKVEPGEKVMFALMANDVIHGFNIPAARMTTKFEPGLMRYIWIRALKKPGKYLIQCLNYCGLGHARMKAWLITGNTPHEFMLMTGSEMAAVGYRANRADWNLTEHEAIFEKPLVMTGDRFEMVVKIEKPGAWMFMCMFPYHMQLGMMGALATKGMEGMNMGGMKM